MKCPQCGLINPDSARQCDCGHVFAVPDAPSPRPPQPPPIPSPPGPLDNFFMFRVMISPFLIRCAYVLGAVAITFAGVATMFWGYSGQPFAPAAHLAPFWRGLLTVIVGNIAWRVTCEWAILLFSIHAEVRETRRAVWRGR